MICLYHGHTLRELTCLSWHQALSHMFPQSSTRIASFIQETLIVRSARGSMGVIRKGRTSPNYFKNVQIAHVSAKAMLILARAFLWKIHSRRKLCEESVTNNK